MLLAPAANQPRPEIDKSEWTTDYAYVFVHGLIGWGEDTFMENIISYFGTFSGSLMRYLRSCGLNCHTATLSVNNSAWDRACELYAQLTGTRTDYGEAHSARCHHPRYGRNYTGRALLDEFDAEHKINLIGHSFGGATALVFLELMANGDAAECEASQDSTVSPLFEGGKADWIYSLTTLASPTNGTTLYEIGNSETVSLDGHDRYPGHLLADHAGSSVLGYGGIRYAGRPGDRDRGRVLNDRLRLLFLRTLHLFPAERKGRSGAAVQNGIPDETAFQSHGHVRGRDGRRRRAG